MSYFYWLGHLNNTTLLWLNLNLAPYDIINDPVVFCFYTDYNFSSYFDVLVKKVLNVFLKWEKTMVLNMNCLTRFFIPWETPSIIQVTHMKPSLGVHRLNTCAADTGKGMDMKHSCISWLCCCVHHFFPEDEIQIFKCWLGTQTSHNYTKNRRGLSLHKFLQIHGNFFGKILYLRQNNQYHNLHVNWDQSHWQLTCCRHSNALRFILEKFQLASQSLPTRTVLVSRNLKKSSSWEMLLPASLHLQISIVSRQITSTKCNIKTYVFFLTS